MATCLTTTMASNPEKYLKMAGMRPGHLQVLAACDNDYDKLAAAHAMGLSEQEIVANHLAELDEQDDY